MIIVSSAQQTERAIERYNPGFVISLIDRNETDKEQFDQYRPDNFLQLTLDCSAADFEQDVEKTVHSIVKLAREWRDGERQKSPILIHCHEGVSRSMAAAYIFLCAAEHETCERKIIERIRFAAPHADPNIMLIAAADKILERDDRMVEAVLDMSPCSAGAVTEAVTLQVNT